MLFNRVALILQNIPIFWKYLAVFILGLAPISEVRGAIIIGFSLGLNPFAVILLSLIANILVIPLILIALKIAHINDLALKLFGKRTMRKIEKNRKRFEIYHELALLLFVAIPLPMTGAWTGALIAHILKFNKLKSFIIISLGVIIASIIVSISYLGVFSIF